MTSTDKNHSGDTRLDHWLRKRSIYHTDVIRLHGEGLTQSEIADAIGISTPIVRSCFSDLGLKARRGSGSARAGKAKRSPIEDKAIDLLANGFPVLRISKELGVSRAVIYRILKDRDIKAPDISEGNRLSAKFFTKDERRDRARAAYTSFSTTGMSKVTAFNGAIEKECSGTYIGIGEGQVCEELIKAGLSVTPQAAIDSYNIDILCGNVAVEVHRAASNPLSSTQRLARAIDLMNKGINVFYIWMPRDGRTIDKSALDDLIAYCNFCGSNPTFIGQYRVIRSNGESVFSADRYMDKITAVVMARSRL